MRILIVDNDPLFSRLVKTKLESWGHTVAVDGNGVAAWERIQQQPQRVVILENEVPGVSGPELCRRIRAMKRARYTFVLFYSGNKDAQLAALEAGADDFLMKPLNTVELRLRLKNAKRMLNLEDDLAQGAGLDRMTGVINDASFRQFFRVTVAEARRTQSVGALMFVTVKNYRAIHDEHGYEPAQALMAEISKVLVKSVRSSDLVARAGPEVFYMLLQNTYWDRCRVVADKLIAQFANMSVNLEGTTMHPDIGMETVGYPEGDKGSDDILAAGNRVLIR
jgi:two-component system, cell cycle response regulator